MSSARASRSCVVVFAVLFSAAVIAYSLYVAHTKQPTTDNQPPSTKTGSRALPSLRFVVIVSRHGNRRPLFSFPNDPYPDKYWTCALGEITKTGKTEMYNLGMKIRSLYNGFLDNDYHSTDFYATSTALERTLVSGEAFSAGLYPPTGFQVWNEEIPWQPIPIYTDSPDDSQILNYPCPRYAIETMAGMIEYLENYTEVISKTENYLSNYTGANSSEDHYLYNIWDSFLSEETEGFVLPTWTKEVYPDPLNDLMRKMFIVISAGTDTITSLVSSEMFIQMVGLMEDKINNTLSPDYKMYFYSAHDITIVSLQAVLGIPKSSIIGLVNPGSALIYELHRDLSTNNHYVQVFYIDGVSSDLELIPINIPDCGPSCDFNQFLNITSRFLNFTSEKDECLKTT